MLKGYNSTEYRGIGWSRICKGQDWEYGRDTERGMKRGRVWWEGEKSGRPLWKREDGWKGDGGVSDRARNLLEPAYDDEDLSESLSIIKI